MPTYDYQCRSCGVIREVIHSMLEDGPGECERCGGQVRRVVHPTGIIFRGSGFYKTDSRSSSSASETGASRPAAPSAVEGAGTPTGSSTSGPRDAAPAPGSSGAGSASTPAKDGGGS